MKFRTELKITSATRPIALTDRVVALGSCFATELIEAFSARNLHAEGNFMGPLFNPLSIAAAIRRAHEGRAFTLADLPRNEVGEYFSFEASTRFTDPSAERLAERLNAANEQLRTALEKADHLLLTFGTAWVYRLRTTGEVVANCHRQPAAQFYRERLSVSEIAGIWKPLLQGLLADKQVILTVSPIRHLGDGLEGNAVSKATLRLAIEELVTVCPNVLYFPAYELLLDDLRDYRFYADDLVHPSRQAVAYIWEKFVEMFFTAEDQRHLTRIERALAFCQHRPLNPASEPYRQGVRATLDELHMLEQTLKIDFSAQIEALESELSCEK